MCQCILAPNCEVSYASLGGLLVMGFRINRRLTCSAEVTARFDIHHVFGTRDEAAINA